MPCSTLFFQLPVGILLKFTTTGGIGWFTATTAHHSVPVSAGRMRMGMFFDTGV